MIDITAELIPFNLIPRAVAFPRPPHLSTVARWVFRGVGNPPIKLATVKIGGRRYTSRAALDAFFAATTGPAAQAVQQLSDRREAAIRRAEHDLDTDGIS